MRFRTAFAAAALLSILALASAASADTSSLRDRARDTPKLRERAELDIVRAKAAHAVGDRIKHKVTMRGRLDPRSKNTRPFILINTAGGPRSAYEFVVVGPRVFEVVDDGFRKVGANKFTARKRTWVYRFRPSSIGAEGEGYGWAALTAKGGTLDLAPNGRYKRHDLSG